MDGREAQVQSLPQIHWSQAVADLRWFHVGARTNHSWNSLRKLCSWAACLWFRAITSFRLTLASGSSITSSVTTRERKIRVLKCPLKYRCNLPASICAGQNHHRERLNAARILLYVGTHDENSLSHSTDNSKKSEA